ncbi:site-specific integrase [Hyphomonas oceanitis]|uniref:Phage integrase n=1 Tax=Hyphomonas oceanitis SCH89 TaxID=1280953 RepID=A0A059G2V7_9PROT|nr:site-specific integrase [Hyphomonas oceanitis]KDA01064.1 Phage integrase [Hyphomonas oceanitis SCH89]
MSSRKHKLTQIFIDSVEPEDKRFIIWDTEIAAFGLRVMPTGVKSFIIRYRIGQGRLARERMVTLGKTTDLRCEAARSKAKDFRSEARIGLDPEAERRRDERGIMKVSALIELWGKEAAPFNRRTGAPRKPQRYNDDIRLLRVHVNPILGKMPITEVKKHDIVRLRDGIASGATAKKQKTKSRGIQEVKGGMGTARRTIAMLKSVFAYALDLELLEKNPCHGVRIPPGVQRERYLTQAEAQRLGEVLSSFEARGEAASAIRIIRLLSLTGARRGEIMELKWSEIDFERGFLRLDATKSGKSIRPISGAAQKLLSEAPRAHETWVFPDAKGTGPYQGLPKIWREVREAAGLEDFRMHDLRHSFASFGAANGLSLPIIGALLGHKNTSTTQRYAHLTDIAARQAANDVSDMVAAALGVSTG